MKIEVEDFRERLEKMRAARDAWYALELDLPGLTPAQTVANAREGERLGVVYHDAARELAILIDVLVKLEERKA